MANSVLDKGLKGLTTIGKWESYGYLGLGIVVFLVLTGVGIYYIFSGKKMEYTEIKINSEGEEVKTEASSSSMTTGITLIVIGTILLIAAYLNYTLTKKSDSYAFWQGANNFF